MEKLWESVALGRARPNNRLAMAPMTRDRSMPDGVPTALNALYYEQRASMGLILTEGTQPSADGQGYLLTPGIYTDAHVQGWKVIADRVHAAGGHIYIELMHVGRVAHPANTPHGRQPVAPSAIRPNAQMSTASGKQDIPEPRALSVAEIAKTVADFRHAAACAVKAGIDGVMIHAANGYLPHQFLSENANKRTDDYGGSLENRVRFTVEVAAGIAEEIGADRTAVHISPGNSLNDIVEGDTPALYHTLIEKLAPLKLAFLSLVQAGDEELLRWIREAWPTALVVNRENRPRADIAVDVDAGRADIASVGRFALANPDLVLRLQTGTPLNEADHTTFYTSGERGYTNYPALANPVVGGARVLFVGQAPDTVDFTDPALPPGFTAEKIQVGINVAAAKIAERGWVGDLCMIPPDTAGIAMLEKQLASATYDCVVIGGGMRLPPKGLLLFEKVVNAIQNGAPGSAIAFNTRPEDTAEAAARWLKAP